MEKLNELMTKACLASEMGKKGITVDLQMLSQIRDEFWAVEKRAEAAEAKLAELEKQQTVSPTVDDLDVVAGCYYRKRQVDALLASHPAPAINLAELVPDEPTGEMQAAGACAIKFETTPVNKIFTANAVYRAMRTVLLRNIEEAE